MHSQTTGQIHHIHRPQKKLKRFYALLFFAAVVGIFINLFLISENSKIKRQISEQKRQESKSKDLNFVSRQAVVVSTKQDGRIFVVRLEDGSLATILLTKDTVTRLVRPKENGQMVIASPDLINLYKGAKIEIKYQESAFSQEHEFPVNELTIL